MSEPVGIAVVGAGDFGRRHIAVAQALPDFTLVGIAERDESRRRHVATAGLLVTATLEELLELSNPDAVLIATPPSAHMGDLRLALERGLHTLVEKPVVTERADLELLRSLPPQQAKLVVPAHVSRFSQDFASLQQEIAGETIRAVRAVRHIPKERLDIHGEIHPALSAMVHDLDLIRALVEGELEEISSAQSWSEPRRPHPQLVSATLKFSSGVLASVENYWTLTHSRQYIDARLEVITDRTTAYLRLPTGGLRLDRAAGEELPSTELEGKVHGLPVGALSTQLRHFAAVVRGFQPRVVTLQDAMWSVDTSLQIAAQAPRRPTDP